MMFVDEIIEREVLKAEAKRLREEITHKTELRNIGLKWYNNHHNSLERHKAAGEKVADWSLREIGRKYGQVTLLAEQVSNLSLRARAVQIARAYLNWQPLSSVETHWYGLSCHQKTALISDKAYGSAYHGLYRERAYKQYQAIEKAMELLGLCRPSEGRGIRIGYMLRYMPEILTPEYEAFLNWIDATHPPEFLKTEPRARPVGRMTDETDQETRRLFWNTQKEKFGDFSGVNKRADFNDAWSQL